MQKLLLILCCVVNTSLFSQTGYDISVRLKPYKNTYIYLGYHYGKDKALADSALLDEHSSGHFKGAKALPGGIYFIVSPAKQILFEILLDKDQVLAVSADTLHLPESVEFDGSEDNSQFQQYSVFATETGREINMLNQQYANARTKKDSADIISRIRTKTTRIELYRDSLEKKFPESFLTTLFQAMNEPKIPPASEHPGGKYDSNFVYEFYKGHYWDDISFADNRLVRTPFFESKLEKYYRDLVAPNPDSLIKEIDHMLLYSRSAEEMYRFLMVYFVQKYINPQYMGLDAVFVHLFEKYINTGKAEFFTPQYKEFTAKRAYSLMANLIGHPAAQLDMVDTAGKSVPLYNIKADFTVICFWDPTCSHCKEVVPKVDSIYNAKWKNEGVKLYGVKTDGSREEWIKFIKDNKLKGWNHVYQLPAKQEAEAKAGRPGYKQLFDVYQTPILYLLDKDKRIIAKKLTYLQIDEVIDARIKANKPK